MVCRDALKSSPKVDGFPEFSHNLILFSGALPRLLWVISLMHAGPDSEIFYESIQKVGNDKFWDDVMYYIIWLGITGVGALITSFLQVKHSLSRAYGITLK